MAKAALCPVCRGSGKKVIMLPPGSGTTSNTSTTLPCHGCGGRGWVVVPEDQPTKVNTWVAIGQTPEDQPDGIYRVDE